MRARSLMLTLSLLLLALPAGAEDKGPEHWEGAIEKIEARYATTPAPKNPILFVGSSSIVFWDLDASFPGLTTLNHGFGGSTMPDLLHYFDRLVTPFAPRGIVLYTGDNDIASGAEPDAVAMTYATFLARVRALWPECPVLILGIKPSASRWKLVDKGRAANALIAEMCEKDAHCSFVNTETMLLTAAGEPDGTLFRSDKLHLNAAGYTKWTDVVRPLLEAFPKPGK